MDTQITGGPGFSYSLVIHEGLADFFTMARNQDPCLAPFTCGAACYTNLCLRTAKNNLTMFNSNLGSQPHLQSQIVSGMLWDIHENGSLSLEDVSQLAFTAVSYLKTSSSYFDLISALLTADLALSGGKNKCVITTQGEKRGLIDLGEISCGNSLDSDPREIPAPNNQRASSKHKLSCATIAGNQGHHHLIWVLLIIPILFSINPRKIIS